MSRREAWSEGDVESLLDSGKAVPRQPAAVRERVMARARAAAALQPRVSEQPPVARLRLRRYIVVPAAAALAVGIAGVAWGVAGHWAHPQVLSGAAPAAVTSSAGVPSALTAKAAETGDFSPAAPALPSADAPAPPAAEARPRGKAPPERREAYEAELGLMRSAHTAYAAHEFSDALVLVGEHARRFPHGLLAEEREALRIRCLSGSGRKDEARRFAAAFAARFPRSVLLPRVQAEVGTSE